MVEKTQKSFRAMYDDIKRRPKPTRQFIKYVAAICAVKEVTVRCWLSGCSQPGKTTCLLLEREFGTPWRVLFPEMAENEKKSMTMP